MGFEFNKLLDTEFLQALYMDDTLYAEEVFGNFLKQTEAEILKLDDLANTGDIYKFRAQLHKIKPTFSLVGLSNLTHESEKLLSICDTSSDFDIILPQYKLWLLLARQWIPFAGEEYQRLQTYNQRQ